MAPLPFFFAAGACIALLVSLFVLFRSLRAAFGSPSEGHVLYSMESERREGLLDEKAALLRSIRDLEFERQMGKLSEEDFQRIDGKFRSRARQVLASLDDELRPYRDEAVRLLGSPVAMDSGASDRICRQCRTLNDDDAVFCKKCAAPLKKDSPAP